VREIRGAAKTIRQLFEGVTYSIDYYQREYKWEGEQVRDLVDDLTAMFLKGYDPKQPGSQVATCPHYFLGSIIICSKTGDRYIVDGQQRLTSLTLFLMVLQTLQKEREDRVDVEELILCDREGTKSFNLNVDDRASVMAALYEGRHIDLFDRSESAQNLAARYRDLTEAFPEHLRGDALPHFVEWLLENVHLVEITAFTDDDAYRIFETINDRGLDLSPTDMLKSYLLANIADERKRARANTVWRDRIRQLGEAGKTVESDFFKAWLRSQYATKVRQRRTEAEPEDFNHLWTAYHRWLREAAPAIGLRQSDDFLQFIESDFSFYSRQHLRLVNASKNRAEGLEHVFYVSQHGFAHQFMVLLAPLRPEDDEVVVRTKLRIVGRFLDIMLAWRLWNFRTHTDDRMFYPMFELMTEIRGLAPEALAALLHARLNSTPENFSLHSEYHTPGVGFYLHTWNGPAIRQFLARITEYIETQSGLPSRYVDYVSPGKARFEIEHVWADHPKRHTDEFSDPKEFQKHRNRIGCLVLLPQSFNASYGDMPYERKLSHYNTQNLLARSLHPQAYEHNPGFLRFCHQSGLPFTAHDRFEKADVDARSELYRLIAERIWNPESLLAESEELKRCDNK
jgi:hypothetical protein